MLQNIPMLVSNETDINLKMEMLDSEIMYAIWGIYPNKELSPDGFTIDLFTVCCHIIRYALNNMVN